MRLATVHFIPVVGDDWYQTRRKDAEGEFFRNVITPRGRGNRQGIYCLTATGRLLASKNAQEADVMLETLEQALAVWQRLPARERTPAAIRIPAPGRSDARLVRTPPEGGLILNVFTRILERKKGEWVRGSCRFPGGEQAGRDHLWLTRAEWQSLVPAEPRRGSTFPVPAAISRRILQFHLVDNTRGEPPFWERGEVRRSRLTLTVEEASASTIRLRLDGSALLATAANPARADRGFDVHLLGYLAYDRGKKTFTRFDLVAVGDHWGEGPYTPDARRGRQPLGIAFTLSSGKRPADRIPPQKARQFEEYMGK